MGEKSETNKVLFAFILADVAEIIVRVRLWRLSMKGPAWYNAHASKNKSKKCVAVYFFITLCANYSKQFNTIWYVVKPIDYY